MDDTWLVDSVVVDYTGLFGTIMDYIGLYKKKTGIDYTKLILEFIGLFWTVLGNTGFYWTKQHYTELY